MSKALIKIPELHNNNYSFIEVLSGLCNTNINNEFTFTDISKYWNKKNKSSFTAVDLFCGCGGISKGLELAGIKVIAGLDFFKEAGETYKTNFNNKFVYGDITKNDTKEELYKTINKELNGRQLNIVAGGFPCQGFLISGRRDVSDPRNKLYLEVVDIVKNIKPRIYLFRKCKRFNFYG